MTARKTTSLDQRVQDLVKHAYKNAPATRNRLDNASLAPKDIQGVADLARIPVMTKDQLVQLQASDPPFGGMLAVPVSELKWIFFSPGPLYEGYSDDEGAIEEAAKLLRVLGFDDSDIVLISISYHLVPFGILYDAGVRKLGGTVLPAGTGNTDLQVKMMLDHGATGYIGTPSFLLSLVRRAEELGINFRKKARLNKAIVTAEPLTPSLREELEAYGLRLVNVYGTAELGALGYETETGKGFKLPEDVLIQICDLDSGQPLPDGEVGEIVVTNFNPAYPLIRLGTGDLSKLDPDSGHMMGWMGRSGEAVKVRGMFLHPNQLGQVMAGFPQVASFQAIIRRPEQRDEFTLRVELTDPSVDKAALEDSLAQGVPQVCRVKPDRIEFVGAGTLAEGVKRVVDERSWE